MGRGNHDQGLSNLLSHLVGVPVFQQYTWEIGGKKHIAVHGHQFDRFSVENGMLCSFGVWIYMLLQRLDSKNQRITRFLDRWNTRWLGLKAKVRRGAFHLAASKGAHRVFCGHTHAPVSEFENGIHYVNSGAWTIDRPSYVMVNADAATLCYWDDVNLGMRIDSITDQSEVPYEQDDSIGLYPAPAAFAAE